MKTIPRCDDLDNIRFAIVDAESTNEYRIPSDVCESLEKNFVALLTARDAEWKKKVEQERRDGRVEVAREVLSERRNQEIKHPILGPTDGQEAADIASRMIGKCHDIIQSHQPNEGKE